MKKIITIAEFENILKLEKAIIFIFFEWSGEAHLSKRVFIDWENQTKCKVPIFEINPEDFEDFSKWIYENNVHGNGYGSIVWLKKGKTLDFEKNAGKCEVSTLEKRTTNIFNN